MRAPVGLVGVVRDRDGVDKWVRLRGAEAVGWEIFNTEDIGRKTYTLGRAIEDKWDVLHRSAAHFENPLLQFAGGTARLASTDGQKAVCV